MNIWHIHTSISHGQKSLGSLGSSNVVRPYMDDLICLHGSPKTIILALRYTMVHLKAGGISESPRPAIDFECLLVELFRTRPQAGSSKKRRRPAIHKSELKSSEKMTYMYYTCRYVIIQLYMLKKGMLADLTIPLFAELDTSPS